MRDCFVDAGAPRSAGCDESGRWLYEVGRWLWKSADSEMQPRGKEEPWAAEDGNDSIALFVVL